jgi:hypothetical protein
MRMRQSIVAAACALVMLPTLASAQNVVYACVSKVTKVVRIVGAAGHCISSPPLLAETPLRWDIQGPQGTPGANGTNGTSVTFLGSFSGNQYGCPNGGTILGTVNGNAYICNGPAATRPAPPCFDNYSRLLDCSNGTVTDSLTGLTWLQQTLCLGPHDYESANRAAAALKDGDCGLTDGSSPGDWRLPTFAETTATLARAWALNCPGRVFTNDEGTECWIPNPPPNFGARQSFQDLPFAIWTSTVFDDAQNPFPGIVARIGVLVHNFVDAQFKQNNTFYVWPVRAR